MYKNQKKEKRQVCMPTVDYTIYAKRVLKLVIYLLHYFIMKYTPWCPDSQANGPTNVHFNFVFQTLLQF